jgi:hypothetical protein
MRLNGGRGYALYFLSYAIMSALFALNAFVARVFPI